MPVTVDGKSLNIEGGGLIEETKPVGAFVDKWENGEYQKEAKVYGAVRSWELDCYEKNVAWTNSVAKYLQEKMKAGESVSLSIDLGDLHSASATVHIAAVRVGYEKGAKTSNFIRRFTVSLQET